MTRRRQAKTLLTASLLAGVIGMAGCRPDFAPYNRLTSLRVMGMQSEPAAPAPGEVATLQALVYTPPGAPQPAYSWTWCPFAGPAGEGYPCGINGVPLDDATLAALLVAARTTLGLPAGEPPPPLDLGSAPTAQLTNSIEPEILAAICAGGVMGLPPMDCTNGFPFRIKLRIQTEGSGGMPAEQVDTIVTAHWRLDPATAANANPTIDGLSAMLDGITPQEIDDQGLLTLPRDVETAIRATVPDGAAEMYAGPDDNGQPATLRERLFLTWFVESGDTEYARTSFIAGSTPFEDLMKNHWTPALKKDYAPDTSRLFVVIHDSRGGIGWKDGLVNLEKAP
jgi:hypothetical protein